MKKAAFAITRTRDGVVLTQAIPSGTNSTRVADPIRVRSIGTRWSDKVTLVANALQDREWRIIAQASSEAALSQVAIDAGGRRLGGEEVRFIDVRASEPASLGIFDGAITVQPGKTDRETTKELVEQMKIDAEVNQGFAYQEFLRNYCQDAEALSKVKSFFLLAL
jgi:hypothetical protein